MKEEEKCWLYLLLLLKFKEKEIKIVFKDEYNFWDFKEVSN